MTRFGSHVGVDDKNREQLIGILNGLLAATMDLYAQVKHAHWNVKGDNFYMWHELFDGIAEGLPAFADSLAERAATLGGLAKGTLRQAADASLLAEYDLAATDGTEHVAALCERFAQFNAAVRESLATVGDLDDAVTEDLLIEILHDTEKSMWFLESHRQGRRPTAPRAGSGRGASPQPR
jgi:starvation-inducible DNA-binding protein